MNRQGTLIPTPARKSLNCFAPCAPSGKPRSSLPRTMQRSRRVRRRWWNWWTGKSSGKDESITALSFQAGPQPGDDRAVGLSFEFARTICLHGFPSARRSFFPPGFNATLLKQISQNILLLGRQTFRISEDLVKSDRGHKTLKILILITALRHDCQFAALRKLGKPALAHKSSCFQPEISEWSARFCLT